MNASHAGAGGEPDQATSDVAADGSGSRPGHADVTSGENSSERHCLIEDFDPERLEATQEQVPATQGVEMDGDNDRPVDEIFDEQVDAEVEETLDPRDELIVAALSAGLTHEKAGQLAGCSAKTVQRLMRDPKVADEVRERRRALVASTAARLTNLGEQAVTALSEVLADSTDSARLRASQIILDQGSRYHRETLIEQSLTDRLAAMEAAIGQLIGGSQ